MVFKKCHIMIIFHHSTRAEEGDRDLDTVSYKGEHVFIKMRFNKLGKRKEIPFERC